MESSDGLVLGSYWFYAPNKGAPIAFAVLFFLSGLVHAYQCWKYNSWKTTGPLPWAALLFVGAFVTREIGAYNYDNLGVFIASTVLFLVAAPVYEGANYLLLGRILRYVPYNSPIHPRRVVTTFLGVDLIIAVLTGVGAPRVANEDLSDKEISVGEALLKAALILQLASMVTFVLIAARFQYRCHKTGTLTKNTKSVLAVLCTSCTCITIRTIYRVVEYFDAASLNVYADTLNVSPVLKKEWFFWFFEAIFMFLNTALLNALHPFRFLHSNKNIYLKQDGVTEVEGTGYQDDRDFFVTLFDPFDIVGLVTGRDTRERFWEKDTESTSTGPGLTPQHV